MAVENPLGGAEAIGAVASFPVGAPIQSLIIRTRSGADPHWNGGLIARWRERAANPAAREPRTEVAFVRLRPRTVAGLSGEEAVVRVRQTRGELVVLALEWEFRGVDGDPRRPNVRLAATNAEPARDAPAEAPWERLLDGARPASAEPRR